MSVLVEAMSDDEKTTKRTGFGRDGEKHVELCLDAGQLYYNLALFSVDMYLRANVTGLKMVTFYLALDTRKSTG